MAPLNKNEGGSETYPGPRRSRRPARTNLIQVGALSSRRRFRLSSRGKSREISTSSATVSPRYSFHDAPRVQLLPIEGKRESGKVLNWIASSKEGAGHFDQGREWRLDNTPHTQRVAPQIFGRSTVSVALRGG